MFIVGHEGHNLIEVVSMTVVECSVGTTNRKCGKL